MESKYQINAYVAHGYYTYTVGRMDQAIDHAQQIIARGCIRNPIDDDSLDVIPVYKVRIVGPGIGETAYPAKFMRT